MPPEVYRACMVRLASATRRALAERALERRECPGLRFYGPLLSDDRFPMATIAVPAVNAVGNSQCLSGQSTRCVGPGASMLAFRPLPHYLDVVPFDRFP